MKRFKRQSDLIKHAVKGVLDRQAVMCKTTICKSRQMGMSETTGDFLERCAAKLRRTR